MSVEPDFTIFIPHSSQVLNALQKVFRRLLSNLLLDFDNPKYQVVKKNNAVLARNISNLPENITEKLFEVIGFQMTDDNTYLFRGTKKTLLEADKFYSQIEDRLAPKSKSSFQPLPLPSKKELPPQAHAHHTSNAKEVVSQNESSPFVTEDFESVTDLQEIVRKTLLKTGRIRNCFFEANYYSLRRMSHGRVYVCSEKCDNTCLEAHWHLLSGRNILYSHVAHLSSDGLKVLHLGFEVGYQYHMIPGMGNFGKSVNFSTKLLSSEGKLLRNEHPNKVPDVTTIEQEEPEEVSTTSPHGRQGYIPRLLKSVIQNLHFDVNNLKITALDSTGRNVTNGSLAVEVQHIQCVKENTDNSLSEDQGRTTVHVARRVSFSRVLSYVLWESEKARVFSAANVDLDFRLSVEERVLCTQCSGSPLEFFVSTPLVNTLNYLVESIFFCQRCCDCPCRRPQKKPTRGDKESVQQWWTYCWWLSKSLKKNRSIGEGLKCLKKENSCYQYYLGKYHAPWCQPQHNEPPLVSYNIHRKCSREASYAIRYYHSTGNVLSRLLAERMSALPSTKNSEWNLLFSYNGDMHIGGNASHVKFIDVEVETSLKNGKLEHFLGVIKEVTLCNKFFQSVVSTPSLDGKSVRLSYYPSELNAKISIECSPMEVQLPNELVKKITGFCYSVLTLYNNSSWFAAIPTEPATPEIPLVFSAESIIVVLDETIFFSCKKIRKNGGVLVDEVSVDIENKKLLTACGFSLTAEDDTPTIELICIANRLDEVELLKDKLAMIASSLSAPPSMAKEIQHQPSRIPLYFTIRVHTITFETISIQSVRVSVDACNGWYVALSALGVSSHSSSCPNATVVIQMWADDYVDNSPFSENIDRDGIAFLILCNNADLVIDTQLVSWIEVLYDLVMLILFQTEDSHVYLHDLSNTVHHICGSIQISTATLTLEQCCVCSQKSLIPAVVIKAPGKDSAVISVQRSSDKSINAQITLHESVTASLRDVAVSPIEVLPFRRQGWITVSIQLRAPPVDQIEVFPFSRLKIDIDISGRAVVPHLPTVMALWHHFDVADTSVNRLRSLPSRMHFGSRQHRNRAPPPRSANSSFFFRTGSAFMERIGSTLPSSNGIYSSPVFPLDLVLRVSAVESVLYYPWNESDESHCSTPMYFFTPVHRFRLLLTSREGLTRLDLSGVCAIPRVRCSTAIVPEDDPCCPTSFQGKVKDKERFPNETAVSVKLVYTHDKRPHTLSHVKALQKEKLDCTDAQNQANDECSNKSTGNTIPRSDSVEDALGAKEDLFLSISGWEHQIGGNGHSSLDGIRVTLTPGEVAAYVTLLTAQRALSAWRLPGYQPEIRTEPRCFHFHMHLPSTVILVPCVGLGVVLWNGLQFKVDMSSTTKSCLDLPRLSCFVHESISQGTLLSTLMSSANSHARQTGNSLHAFQRLEEQGFAIFELRGKGAPTNNREPSSRRGGSGVPFHSSYPFCAPPPGISSAFSRIFPSSTYGTPTPEKEHPIALWYVHTAAVSITEKVLLAVGKIRALHYLEGLQKLIREQKKAVEALAADGKMRWEQLRQKTCSKFPFGSVDGTTGAQPPVSRNLVVVDSLILRVVWLTILHTKTEGLAGIVAGFQSVAFGDESAVLFSRLPQPKEGKGEKEPYSAAEKEAKESECGSLSSPSSNYSGSPRRCFSPLYRQGKHVNIQCTTAEQHGAEDVVNHQRVWSEATTHSTIRMSPCAAETAFPVGAEEEPDGDGRAKAESRPEQVLLLRQGDVSLILVQPAAQGGEENGWDSLFSIMVTHSSSLEIPHIPMVEKNTTTGNNNSPSIQLIPLLHPFCIEPEVVSLPPLKRAVVPNFTEEERSAEDARLVSSHTSLISKLSRIHLELTTTTYLFLYEAQHRLQELVSWNHLGAPALMHEYFGEGSNRGKRSEILPQRVLNPDGVSLDILLSELTSRSVLNIAVPKHGMMWVVDGEDEVDYFTCEKLEDEEETGGSQKILEEGMNAEYESEHNVRAKMRTHYLGLYIEEIRFTVVELIDDEERERNYWKWLAYASAREREALKCRWSIQAAHHTLTPSPQMPLPDLQFNHSFYGACDVLGLSLHPSEMDADITYSPMSRKPSVHFRTRLQGGNNVGRSSYAVDSETSSPKEREMQDDFSALFHASQTTAADLHPLEEENAVSKPNVAHCHSVELVIGPVILLQDQCPARERNGGGMSDSMDRLEEEMVSVVGVHLESIALQVDHNPASLLDLKQLYWHIDGSSSRIPSEPKDAKSHRDGTASPPVAQSSSSVRAEHYCATSLSGSKEFSEAPDYNRRIIGAVEGLDVTLDSGALATVVELLVERPARTLAEIYRNVNLAAYRKRKLSLSSQSNVHSFYAIPGIGSSAMFLHCITMLSWSLEEDLLLSRQHPQGQLLVFSNADTNHLTVYLNHHRLRFDPCTHLFSSSSAERQKTRRDEQIVMVIEEGLTVTFIGGVFQLPFQSFLQAQVRCKERGIDPSHPDSPLRAEALLSPYVGFGEGSYISCKDVRVVFTPDVEASVLSFEDYAKNLSSSDSTPRQGRKNTNKNRGRAVVGRQQEEVQGLFDTQVPKTADGPTGIEFLSLEIHHFSIRLRPTITSSLRFTQPPASLEGASTEPAHSHVACTHSLTADTKDSQSLLITGLFQADCSKQCSARVWDRKHVELSNVAVRTVHANPLRDWTTADTVIIQNWSLDGLSIITPITNGGNGESVREQEKNVVSSSRKGESLGMANGYAEITENDGRHPSPAMHNSTEHLAVELGEVNAEITYQDVTLVTALMEEFSAFWKAKKNMTCSAVEREFRQLLEDAVKWEVRASGESSSGNMSKSVSPATLRYAHNDDKSKRNINAGQTWSYFSHESSNEKDGKMKSDSSASASQFSMVVVFPKILLCMSNHRSPLFSVAADLMIGKSILQPHDQMKQHSVQISGLCVRVFGKGSWDDVLSPPTAKLTWNCTMFPHSQHTVVQLDAVQIKSSLMTLAKIHNIQQQLEHLSSHLLHKSNSANQQLYELFEMRAGDVARHPFFSDDPPAEDNQQVPSQQHGAVITPCTSHSFSEKAEDRGEKVGEDRLQSGQRTPSLHPSNLFQFGTEGATTHCFTNALDKAFYLLFFPLQRCSAPTVIPTATSTTAHSSLSPQLSNGEPQCLSENSDTKSAKKEKFYIPHRISRLTQYEIVEVPPMTSVNLSIPYKRGSEMYVCVLPERCVRQNTAKGVNTYQSGVELLQSEHTVSFLLNKEEVESLDAVIAGVMLGELQYGASKGLVIENGVIVLSCTEDDDLSTYLARGNVMYEASQWKDLNGTVQEEKGEESRGAHNATEYQQQVFRSSSNQANPSSLDVESTHGPTPPASVTRPGVITEKAAMKSSHTGKSSSDVIHIRIHAKTTLRNETGMPLFLCPESITAGEGVDGVLYHDNDHDICQNKNRSSFTTVYSGSYYPVYGACNALRIRVHLVHRVYETLLPLQSTSNSSFLTLSPLPAVSPSSEEGEYTFNTDSTELLRDNQRDSRPLVFYVVVALVANHTSTDIVLLPRLTVINSLGVPVRLTLWQFDARAGPPTTAERQVIAAWRKAHVQTMPAVTGGGNPAAEHPRAKRSAPPPPPANLVLLGAHHALPHEGALCISQCTYASNLYVGISFNQSTGEWVGTPDGEIVQITTDIRRSASSAGAFPIIVPLQQRSGRSFHLLITIRPRTIVLSVAMWVCNMTNYPLLLSDHWMTRKLVSGVDESCGVVPANGSPLLLGVLLHRFDHAFMRIGFDGEWSGAFSTTIGASGIIESRCSTLQVMRSCNYTVYFPNARAHQPAILLITPRWVFCNLTTKRLRVHLDYPGLKKAKNPVLKHKKTMTEGQKRDPEQHFHSRNAENAEEGEGAVPEPTAETEAFSKADRRRIRREEAALAEERAELERASLVSSMATVYLKPHDFYASCVGPASGNQIFLQEDLEGVVPSVEVLDEKGSFHAEHNVASYYEAQRTDALSVDNPGEVLFNLWAVPNPPQRQLATWDGATITAYPSSVVPHPLARERRKRAALYSSRTTQDRNNEDEDEDDDDDEEWRDGRLLSSVTTLEDTDQDDDGERSGESEEEEEDTRSGSNLDSRLSSTAPSANRTGSSTSDTTSSTLPQAKQRGHRHRRDQRQHHNDAIPRREPSLTLFDPHSALDAAVTGRLAVAVTHSHDNVLVVSIRRVVSTQICVHNRTLSHTVVVRQQGSARRSAVPCRQNRYFSWEESSGERILLVHLLGCKGAWYVVDLNRGECEVRYHELDSERRKEKEANSTAGAPSAESFQVGGQGQTRSNAARAPLFHVMALTNPTKAQVTILVTTESIPTVARQLFSTFFFISSASTPPRSLSSPSFSRMTVLHLSAMSIMYRLIDEGTAEKTGDVSSDVIAHRTFSMEEASHSRDGGHSRTLSFSRDAEELKREPAQEEDSALSVTAFTLLLHGFTVERLDAGNTQNFRVAVDVAQLLVQRGDEPLFPMMYRALPTPPSNGNSNYRKAVMMALLSRLRGAFARPHLLEGRYNLVQYPDGMKRLTEGAFYVAPLVLELSDLDLAQWLIEAHAVQRFLRSLNASQQRRRHLSSARHSPDFSSTMELMIDTPSFSPAAYLSNVIDKLKEDMPAAVQEGVVEAGTRQKASGVGTSGSTMATSPATKARGTGRHFSSHYHVREERAAPITALRSRHHISRSMQNDASEADHFILIDRLRVDKFSLFLSFRRDPSDPLRPLLGPYTLMLPNAMDHTEFSLRSFALDYRVETSRSLKGKLRQWCRNGLREQWTKITKLGTLFDILRRSGQPPLEPRPLPLTVEVVSDIYVGPAEEDGEEKAANVSTGVVPLEENVKRHHEET